MAISMMPTTHWSVVLAAGVTDPAARRTALEALAKQYRRPVYEFIVRHQRGSRRDAEDLTQEVFAKLLQGNGVSGVDPAIGKFRAWLLGVVKHCVANHRRYKTRAKRDDRQEDPVSKVEYALADGGDDAELAYHRTWIQTQYQSAQRRLMDESEERGDAAFVRALLQEIPDLFFGEEAERGSYAPLAEKLGLSQGNLKVKVHRLRERFSQVLRDEVAQTVGSDDAVDSEIAELLQTLERGGRSDPSGRLV